VACLTSPGAGAQAEIAKLKVMMSGCSCAGHTCWNADNARSPCLVHTSDFDLEAGGEVTKLSGPL
jgi:hypothetical protein